MHRMGGRGKDELNLGQGMARVFKSRAQACPELTNPWCILEETTWIQQCENWLTAQPLKRRKPNGEGEYELGSFMKRMGQRHTTRKRKRSEEGWQPELPITINW